MKTFQKDVEFMIIPEEAQVMRDDLSIGTIPDFDDIPVFYDCQSGLMAGKIS
jgi:hypothetical protein